MRLPSWIASLAPVPDDLGRVERVAGRLLAHCRRDSLPLRVGSRREEVRDESRDLVVAEGGERNAPHSAPLQLGERAAELIG